VSGTRQSFNKSAATIFGYEAAEIVGQNVSKLIPWKIAKRHDKFMKRYLEGGRKSKIIGSSRELKALHKVCCILSARRSYAWNVAFLPVSFLSHFGHAVCNCFM
jgi:PAS domain-containing protein